MYGIVASCALLPLITTSGAAPNVSVQTCSTPETHLNQLKVARAPVTRHTPDSIAFTSLHFTNILFFCAEQPLSGPTGCDSKIGPGCWPKGFRK